MVDHDVGLEGSYVIEFSNFYARDRGNFNFRRITYILTRSIWWSIKFDEPVPANGDLNANR